jgi:hypothetical protein
VVSQHFAVVAHVNDDGVVGLAGIFEGLQHAADLCVVTAP